MKSWNRKQTVRIIIVGIAGGFLFIGCGKKSATNANNSSVEAAKSSKSKGVINWSQKGTAFTAITTLAKKRAFSGVSGVVVTFFDEDVPLGTSIFKKNCVEVFFPAQESGYGKPTSVAFHKGSQTVQESSNSGYDGWLMVNGSKLSGELNISKIGYDEDSSISGSFEATLTDQ